MSEFKELLNDDGYEYVKIITIGKDFLQPNFGEYFCENSTLSLVLDTSEDFINFEIRTQFNVEHTDIVILDSNGIEIGRVLPEDNPNYQDYLYGLIVENYNILEISDIVIPNDFTISSPYPNPFNPETNIDYIIPKDSFLSINVYDINGNLIDNIFNQDQYKGSHKITWNASKYNSGIYFIKFISRDYQNTQKVLLIK